MTTTRTPNTIHCLNGIRVLSMVWVMYAHTYSSTITVPKINTIDLLSWIRAPWSMHVLNATVSVDSFFFISGVLVAWMGFRELDRTKGQLNVLMMYFHRYIRLTPPLAAVILFLVTLNKFIGSGPFRKTTVQMEGCDGNTWWPPLLYIQNYYLTTKQCVPQTWYLAIDFQLYVLSPLLLIPMWKWGKRFVPVLIVLALLSIGCVMATFFTEGYRNLTGLFEEGIIDKTYVPMHTRYSPWLVGFGLGYFMHINRQNTFHVSKVLQFAGWTISFIIFVSILFGPYFTLRSGLRGTVVEATMYESLKRVSWSIGLAWITFACHFEFGGIVDTFLSHPLWQPLGRLTYSLFLVHIFVLSINFGVMRTEVYFSDYDMILYFWSTFGTSLMAAIVLTLAFESPVLLLEKAFFGSQKRRNKVLIAGEGNGDVELPNKDEK